MIQIKAAVHINWALFETILRTSSHTRTYRQRVVTIKIHQPVDSSSSSSIATAKGLWMTFKRCDGASSFVGSDLYLRYASGGDSLKRDKLDRDFTSGLGSRDFDGGF